MPQTELTRNATQTIGTTTAVVSEELSYGQQRNVIFITNTSAGGQKITISPSDQAVSGAGIVLAPGGFYQESNDNGFKATNARITAISDIAGGTIAIHERIIMKGF